MAGKRVTLFDIAKKLGVSAMTVSIALRGKPGLSEERRAEVLATAKKMGYAPDPVAAELMSLVRSRKPRRQSGNLIAYINTFSRPEQIDQVATFHAFFEGAVKRGREFGYNVEQFVARAPGMTGARLTRILKARGVRGVLVGARWYDDPEIDLDWSAFSVVLVGEVEYGPNIYRVCNHHVHSCNIALQSLQERGYKRIGVALTSRFETSRGFDFALGADLFWRQTGKRAHVDTWLYATWSENAFREWVKSKRLDAVISLEPEVGHAALKLSTAAGEPVGYACLDIGGDSPWSGINQYSEEIGVAAMELLRNLLLGGQRGAAPRPRVLLIEGAWVDGSSTRPLPAPPPSIPAGAPARPGPRQKKRAQSRV